MNQPEVIEIIREAIMVLIAMSAAPLIVGLIVGIVVSLIQAITQIQEMTLTFIPKILAIFATLIVALPFMMTTLINFTQQLMDRISNMQ